MVTLQRSCLANRRNKGSSKCMKMFNGVHQKTTPRCDVGSSWVHRTFHFCHKIFLIACWRWRSSNPGSEMGLATVTQCEIELASHTVWNWTGHSHTQRNWTGHGHTQSETELVSRTECETELASHTQSETELASHTVWNRTGHSHTVWNGTGHSHKECEPELVTLPAMEIWPHKE